MTSTAVVVATRPVRPDDDTALRAIFRSRRETALDLAGWPAEVIRAFCDQQFDLQQAHYRRVFDDLDQRVIVDVDGDVIGQITLDQGSDVITIVDIALLPDHCGQGIGGEVLSRVTAGADRRGVPTCLSVDLDNPRAERLYRRAGFDTVSSTELQNHMRRDPTGEEPE